MWRQCTQTGFDTCQAELDQRSRCLVGRRFRPGLLAEGGLPEDPAADVKRVNALLV